MTHADCQYFPLAFLTKVLVSIILPSLTLVIDGVVEFITPKRKTHRFMMRFSIITISSW